MKKAIFKSLAFLFIFVLLFLYFNDPPTGEKYITDPARYLRTNDFVRETRGKSFVKVLPDEIPSGTVPEYRYWYYCALLGEPVYSLSLKLSKCSPEYVRAERQRMTDLDGFIKFDTADGELWIKEENLNNFERYYDDELLDGCEYPFEIVSLGDDGTISYLEAYVVEGLIFLPEIEAELKQVYEIIQNSSQFERLSGGKTRADYTRKILAFH